MARILVVDDEEGIRTFVADALARTGHIICQACDGSDAQQQIGASGFDLVVTDLKMPKMDGLQLLHWAKEQQPELEFVIMTAHGSVQTAVDAMKAGAFDFLQKPLSGPSELRLLVDRALERRSLRDLKAQVQTTAEDPFPLTYGAPAMKPLVAALKKVAPTHASVLLLGPSGTGKECCARRLHLWSERSEAPFVAINCAALTDSLLESTLFGHEKGAFTGADKRQRGQLELAQGGTFFLDEIGELKLELQAKLLRVLEERQFQRVGGHQLLTADVRFVAATNRNLSDMVTEGRFREDLYHRLAVFPIAIPPLDQRREDIPGIAAALLAGLAPQVGTPQTSLSPALVAQLQRHSWPGNIRQLRNTLERALILAEGDTLTVADLWLDPTGNPASANRPTLDDTEDLVAPLAEIERQAVLKAVARHDGNRAAAARQLGISVRSLYDRLKRYDADG